MFAVIEVKITNNECFKMIPRSFNGILFFSFCTAELYNTRLCIFFYKLFMNLINSLHRGTCASANNTRTRLTSCVHLIMLEFPLAMKLYINRFVSIQFVNFPLPDYYLTYPVVFDKRSFNFLHAFI